MTHVYFYISPTGKSPVGEFMYSLAKNQRTKVDKIIDLVKKYGLPAIYPYVKKLSGTPLWEIRIVGKDNIRFFYIGRKEEKIILLHAFIKKTQKTPTKEIMVALQRLKKLKAAD